jgi:hypothetical protein
MDTRDRNTRTADTKTVVGDADGSRATPREDLQVLRGRLLLEIAAQDLSHLLEDLRAVSRRLEDIAARADRQQRLLSALAAEPSEAQAERGSGPVSFDRTIALRGNPGRPLTGAPRPEVQGPRLLQESPPEPVVLFRRRRLS